MSENRLIGITPTREVRPLRLWGNCRCFLLRSSRRFLATDGYSHRHLPCWTWYLCITSNIAFSCQSVERSAAAKLLPARSFIASQRGGTRLRLLVGVTIHRCSH